MALLAFLALEPGPHAREELATLFWGHATDSAARASLRQALRAMRTAVGDQLEADRRSVRLRPGVACDVAEFRRQADDDPPAALRHNVPQFLSGITLRDAPAFEEWADGLRATLLRQYVKALRTTARQALRASRWAEAAALGERWLVIEPLSDEAARFVAEAYFMAGDNGTALARLTDYMRRVRAETGAAPDPALGALAERIAGSGRGRRARRSSGAAREPGFDASLVGREAEWRTLMGLWSAVTRGESRVVLIEGDLGVGKTRLAEEVLRWARAGGASVLDGRGYDAAGGIAYAPIADALSDALDAPGLPAVSPEWLAEVARLHPGVRDRFRHLPAPAGSPEGDRRWRLFEAVAQVILGLAAERPTVLAIDDLQLCDAETCALLQFLTQRVDAGPVLFLFTESPGEVERTAPTGRLCRTLRAADRTTIVSLGPLDAGAVQQLVRDVARITEPSGGRRLAKRLHAMTDGNPFHIVELLKSVFAQGLVTVDPATGAWQAAHGTAEDLDGVIGLPRSVTEAVQARCAGLPYELRDLLALVAVAGRGASTPLMSRVLGLSRMRAAALADSLVDRRLLAQESTSYRCAHPVIRDVVRKSLTSARLQEMHRAIASALDESGEPSAAGDIAHHAERGGEPALAYQAALRAAQAAAAQRVPDEALAWFEFAARVAPSPADADAANRRANEVRGASATGPPRRRRRAGTPTPGLTRRDLDLGIEPRD
jgi:DNA-binding SARP family transcriptional activator